MTKLEDVMRKHIPQSHCDLFLVFARFEYAMKRSDMCDDNNNNFPQADWNKLADNLTTDFFDRFLKMNLIEIFLEAPPNNQRWIVDRDIKKWDWETPCDAPIDARTLFKCVKAVRNNMIHGEKIKPSRDDANRNDALVVAALNVLNNVYRYAQENAEFEKFNGHMYWGDRIS